MGTIGPGGESHDRHVIAEQITEEVKQQSKELASQVADETRSVTEVARSQGHEMVEGVRSSVRSEAQTQSDRLVQSLREVGGQLDDMAQGKAPTEGIALDAVRRVAAEVKSTAERLDDRGVDGTLDDLRGYARRHPGMFLAGAFAVGFVGGRMLRNVDSDVLTASTASARADNSRSRPQGNRLEEPEAGYGGAEAATFADVEETAPGAADFLPGRPAGGGRMP